MSRPGFFSLSVVPAALIASPRHSERAQRPLCHSERAQRVEESARCRVEIAAQGRTADHAETRRRRGLQLLSGSSTLHRRTVPLHPRFPTKTSWGRHSAVIGAAALLGPPHPPRLRVIGSCRAPPIQPLTTRMCPRVARRPMRRAATLTHSTHGFHTNAAIASPNRSSLDGDLARCGHRVSRRGDAAVAARRAAARHAGTDGQLRRRTPAVRAGRFEPA